MAQDEKSDPRWGVLLGGRGLGTVTDLLLRKAQAGRAGAQGDDDYDCRRGEKTTTSKPATIARIMVSGPL
jgi:hypothetical protein